MTKEELLIKLRNIEWDDFEVKEAKGELPKNVWDTVSAFANTSGGWIVLGIHEDRRKGKSEYAITGVGNPEKIEQDFLGTLRSQKFNLVIPLPLPRNWTLTARQSWRSTFHHLKSSPCTLTAT